MDCGGDFFHARPAEINPSYAVGTKKTLFSPGNIQISLQKSGLHFLYSRFGLSLGLFLPKDFQFFKTDLKSPKAGIPFEKTGLESREATNLDWAGSKELQQLRTLGQIWRHKKPGTGVFSRCPWVSDIRFAFYSAEGWFLRPPISLR